MKSDSVFSHPIILPTPLKPPHRKVIIKAKIVVSAAGALHTPALLLRSKLAGRGGSGQVGAYLALHPVLGAGGVFPDLEVS